MIERANECNCDSPSNKAEISQGALFACGFCLVVFLTVAFCLVGCSLACWCKVFVFVGWLVDLVWSLIGLFWGVVFGFCDCSFSLLLLLQTAVRVQHHKSSLRYF